MVQVQTPPTVVSYDRYHQLEQLSVIRHELVNGIRCPMVGGTDLHNLITGNWVVLLKTALRGRGCRVFFSDMNVRVGDNARYPDVFVTCADDDNHPLYKTQPIIVIEVLSDSTARLDRGVKFAEYRQLPSLQDYLLVSQTTVHVEHFSRAHDWTPSVRLQNDTLELKALSLTIPVATVYEDTGLM